MNFEEYVKNLKTLVNIDSGSHTPEGCKKMVEFFKSLYKGWIHEVYNGNDGKNPVLIIKNRECEKFDFLFIGHMDTVFAEGTAKERPFSENKERFYGPGVIDMKSGCLSIYETVKDLKDKNKNICIIYNTDEEIGSEYSKEVIEEYGKKTKYAFVFEPARKNGNAVKERKGIFVADIAFSGKSAHSGVNPEEGINANIEAAYWTLELSKLQDLKNNNSINVGVIEGGSAVNVVSNKASIKIEARTFNVQFFKTVKEKIESLKNNPYVNGVKVEISNMREKPPLALNENTKKLIAVYEDVKKEMGLSFNWESTGGGSDANILGGMDTAVVDGLGPVGGELHSEKEYLEIKSIEERLILTKKVLEKLM